MLEPWIDGELRQCIGNRIPRRLRRNEDMALWTNAWIGVDGPECDNGDAGIICAANEQLRAADRAEALPAIRRGRVFRDDIRATFDRERRRGDRNVRGKCRSVS